MRNLTVHILLGILLAGCGDSSMTALGKCENDAQKAIAGVTANGSSEREQLEDQRIELVRSCMVANGFKFKSKKYSAEHPGFYDEKVAKQALLKAEYWE